MEKTQNLLLDFTHIYPEEIEKEADDITRIDMSDIRGTDMYCSPEAQEEIRRRLQGFGPEGIHFLDNGNYHYVTKLFVEKIRIPFSLVLFDHHSDMQQPLIHELTSCGSWAGELLWKNPYLRQMILIGPDPKTVRELPDRMRKKAVCVSLQETGEQSAENEIKRIDTSLPAYISIDKDVLDRYGARTNWNQGGMSVRTLERLLSGVFANQKVIGVDICGECSLQEPLREFLEDSRINQTTNRNLYSFLSGRLYSSQPS